MAANVIRGASILLGKCVPSVKQNASKVRITRMILDENLLMYFREHDYVFAHDPEKQCKTGDIVLVRQLPEKLTTLITHKIEKVLYKLGDVIDPVTGKLVVKEQYRDVMEETNRLYGKSKSAFDYHKAPPRGRLEGDRDLTDKPTYIKYHDDGDNSDPYAW